MFEVITFSHSKILQCDSNVTEKSTLATEWATKVNNSYMVSLKNGVSDNLLDL